jgi:hypothetical protein
VRERKLTREEAIEEYLVYHIRTYEFLQIFQMAVEIMEGRYKPENSLGHSSPEFLGSLRSQCIGLFASLMDPQAHALNIFDVWVVLYPEKQQQIVDTWEKIEPHIQLIRDYRNDVAFHANKDLCRYFDTRSRFRGKKKGVIAAMQDFWGLAAELIKLQPTALREFRQEIEPALKKALPHLNESRLEKLKDYFIQNGTLE